MAREHPEERDKLMAAWCVVAQRMIDLGYDPKDVFETMVAVALVWELNDRELAAPAEDVREELPEIHLPRATWEFARLSEQ